jgi:hypothetical protein
MVRLWAKENAQKVFGFVAQILSTGGGTLPHEVYFEALKVAKFWCQHSKKSFIIHELFM